MAAQASSFTAEALLTELSQAQTELAVIEGRRESLRTVLGSHRASLEELKARIGVKEGRTQELLDERESLLARLTTQREQASQLNDRIVEVVARIEPAEDELRVLEERQTAVEDEEGQGREALHRQEIEHSRLALEHGRRQDELEMLRRQIEEDLGLVEVELITGVSHQIRAQLSTVGHAILGDRKYGAKPHFSGGNIALYSKSIRFVHPTRKEPITILAPAPSHWPIKG